MKMIKISLFLVTTFFFIPGCISFHSMSYEVNMYDKNSGLAKVEIRDLRSDAKNEDELKLDKQNIFDYAYKSDTFVKDMLGEGKEISQRVLSVEDGKLNAHVQFFFNDINKVESIIHTDTYYFLTVELTDSIMSTNGVIVKSENMKRIIWDDTTKVLKFKMFSEDLVGKGYKSLAQYFDEK